jgi:hypothetical protein
MASLPLTIAVIFGVFAMLPPRSGVTKANFDQIEKGMTKRDVEIIFGRQDAIVWGDPPLTALRGADKCYACVDNPRDRTLSGRAAWVFFDKNGCVSHATWVEGETSVFDKIRRWLHID